MTLRKTIERQLSQWKPLLLENKEFKHIAALNMTYWIALGGYSSTLLPLCLASEQFGTLSPTEIGVFFMGNSFYNLGLNRAMATVGDKAGKRETIIGGCTLYGVSIAMLPFLSGAGGLSGLIDPRIATWFVVFGLGNAAQQAGTTPLIADIVKEKQFVQASALNRTGGDIGFALGAILTGQISENIGNQTALLSLSGLMISHSLFYWRTMHKRGKLMPLKMWASKVVESLFGEPKKKGAHGGGSIESPSGIARTKTVRPAVEERTASPPTPGTPSADIIDEPVHVDSEIPENEKFKKD